MNRPCRVCGVEGRRKARDLCHRCYNVARAAGRLAEYPLLVMPRDHVLSEYPILRRRGLTHREIAHELGMSFAAFDRALVRARAAGFRVAA